ncbi:MAG: N-acetylmuramoyl-L-alanine amidase [Shimia sp.]
MEPGGLSPGAQLSATWRPSPNVGPRRDGLTPAFIVLHYTAISDFEEACAYLCDPAKEVSAHYVIDRDGTLAQLVREKDRAWHAGAGAWRGMEDINSRSLGIEIVNTGKEPFPEAQLVALERLLSALMARWRIAPRAVIGHSDMAPGRKHDPGRLFPWDRLSAAGLALGPRDVRGAASDMPFAEAVRAAGYPNAPGDVLLDAFRSRFAPTRQGPVTAADAGEALALSRLTAAPPVG